MPPAPPSRVKGIRLPNWISEVLDYEASERNVSVNSLIVSILAKYAEWDRFAQKFGFVSIPDRILKSAFYELEKPQIIRIAESHVDLARELVDFWFKRITTENLVNFFQLNHKYSGLFQHEQIKDLHAVTFILKHNLGRNWSEYVKASAEKTLTSILGSPPKTEIFEGSIRIKIPLREETVVINDMEA